MACTEPSLHSPDFLHLDHYEVLGVQRDASIQELRTAFYARARLLHPDKGGSSAAFARCQEAMHILGDSRSRQVYDQLVPPPPTDTSQPWPTTSRHRTSFAFNPQPLHDEAEEDWGDKDDGDIWSPDRQNVQGTRPKQTEEPPQQGSMVMRGAIEGALLEILAAQGLECNASTQLVVTCEVCSRPATRSCSACTMPVCELCTRRMHAKGIFGMHWPVVVAPGSLTLRIAKQQQDQREIAEAAEHERAQPGFLPPAKRALRQSFMEAAILAAVKPNKQVRYDPDLAPFYLWTQTDFAVYLAVHIPTGSPSTPAVVHVEEVVEGGGWSSSSRAIVLSVGSGREKVIPSRPSNLALCGSSNSKHEFLEGACQDEGRLNVEKDEFATEDSSGSRYCGLEVPGSRSADPRGVDDGSDSDDNASSSEDSEQSCYSTASNHGSAAEEAGQQDGDGKPTFAVVERQVAGKLDTSVPIQATQTEDSQFAIITLPKANPGTMWPSLFIGDPEGQRLIPGGTAPLYRLDESDPDEVVMELQVPWWTSPDHVTVDITESGVFLQVRRASEAPAVRLRRTFWQHGLACASEGGQRAAVIPEQCTWALQKTASKILPEGLIAAPGRLSSGPAHAHPNNHEKQQITKSAQQSNHAATRNAPLQRGFLGSPALPTTTKTSPKLLSVVFVRPASYKEKSKQNDGAMKHPHVSFQSEDVSKRTPFFVEDEDKYGLSRLLQAAVFRASGKVYISSSNVEGGQGRWVSKEAELPKDVQLLLTSN